MSRRRKQAILRLVGIGLAGAGTVGIVVPLWPTTCFYLGALWCFSRSAPHWVDRVFRIPGIGPTLRTYLETGTLPARLLVRTGIWLWTGLVLTWAIVRPGPLLTAVLLLVGASVSLHLHQLSRRSRIGGVGSS